MILRLHPWFATIVLFGFSTALSAHDPVPVQGDFVINSSVPGDQTTPVVAVDEDGAFVVAWTSTDASSVEDSDAAIYVRRFDGNGVPEGSQMLVNQTTAGLQNDPAISGSDSGKFTVAWVGPDGSGTGIFARSYNSNGTPSSNEIPVNTTTAGNQLAPCVANSEHGDFLVVWQSPNGSQGVDIFGRLYDQDGVALSAEFQINTSTAGDQIDPVAVASDESGAYVVAWSGFDGQGRGIFARLLASTGAFLTTEIPVNSTTAGDQTLPALAMSGIDIDTNNQNLFVVVWQSPDGDGSGIFVQRFEDDGTPFGVEERVNLDVTGDQLNPAVAVDDGIAEDVSFVVSWQEGAALFDLRGAPILIRGRRIRGRSTTPPPAAAAIALNATGTLVADPKVGTRPDGWFVGVWQSSGGDGNGFGVIGRRFQVPLFGDGFEDGTTAGWSSSSPLVKSESAPP